MQNTEAAAVPGRKRGLAPAIRKLKLRHPELTNGEIAKRVGCNPANVTGVLKTFLGSNTEDQLRQFQENKAEVYDSVAMRLIESVDARKIAKSSALQIITAVGILHDKAALLRGQPTSINLMALVDIVEAIRARQG
jgi:hypothetical protein